MADQPHRRVPRSSALVRADRRRGVFFTVSGFIGAIAGMMLAVQSGLRGIERPQLTSGALFLASIALYGTGIHQLMWASKREDEVIPVKLRALISAFVALMTWFVIATIAGVAAAWLKEKQLGG